MTTTVASTHTTPLSGLSKPELIRLLTEELGWPRFRADQIHKWVYAKVSGEPWSWSDLAHKQRALLSERFRVPLLATREHQVSADGNTRKFLFELPDGQMVEAVRMQFRDRARPSACVSSQVGCAVGCPFCATGELGLKRNLTAAEIVDQVMAIQRHTGERIGNVVFMGQGEPLQNLREVTKAVQIFRESVGIGARQITISTSGLVPQIRQLATEKLQLTLAISLHAPDQELRQQLVPVAKRWPLPELMESLGDYFLQTHRRITFEYTLMEDVNDSPEQARALADLLRGLPFPCLLNLIPYNETSGLFRRPSAARIQAFKSIAERANRKVTVRLTMGDDIDAACGQLANKPD